MRRIGTIALNFMPVALVLVLTGLAPAQAAAAAETAAATGTAPAPAQTPQPAHKTVDLKVTAAEALKWTPAPDGLGEFVLCFGITIHEAEARQQGLLLFSQFDNAVRVGDDCYLGTQVGLLRRTGKGPWQIVPALYGRFMRPVVVEGKTLWLDEWDFSGRPIGIVGLGLETQKIAVALPGAKGRLVRADHGELLCLTGEDVDWVRGSSALVAYNVKGEEVWRRTFGARRAVSALVTPEATWATAWSPQITNIIPPPTTFRIDAVTRETKEVDSKLLGLEPWGWQMLLYDRGAFLRAAVTFKDKAGSVRLQEIDCRTLQVREGPEAPYAGTSPQVNLRAAGDTVWMTSPQPVAFSRKTLAPIDPKEAGDPPKWTTYEVLKTDPPKLPVSLVAAGGSTAWLGWDAAPLAALTDKGETLRVDLPEEIAGLLKTGGGMRFEMAGRWLCLGASAAIATLDLPSRKATVYTHPGTKPGNYLGYALAGGGNDSGTWVRPGKLGWLDFRTPAVTEVGLPSEQNSFSAYRQEAVAGDQLVAMVHSGDVYRIVGPTGKVDKVASWRGVIYPAAQGDPKDEQSAFTWLKSDVRRVYLTPDGWLGVVALVSERELGMHFLDVAKGTWQEGEAAWTEIVPFWRGDRLYGAGARKLWEWKDHKWSPVAGLPPALCNLYMTNLKGSSGGYLLNATEEYLYAQTPIGLYRVRWAEVLKNTIK
jgi:hypothetical protein